MSFGIDNITYNQTTNTTVADLEGLLGNAIGEGMIGSYNLIGLIMLGAFAVILWRSNVSLDASVVFMVPTLFIFGKYGLLPGSGSIGYGLAVSLGGLLAYGLYRYFR